MSFENYSIIEPFNLYGLVQHVDGRFGQLQFKTTKDYLQNAEQKEKAQQRAISFIKNESAMKDGIKEFDEKTQQKSGIYADKAISKVDKPMGGKKKTGEGLFPLKQKRGAVGLKQPAKLSMYD